MSPSLYTRVINRAEDLVKDHMKSYDPSHDWHHGASVQPSIPALTTRLVRLTRPPLVEQSTACDGLLSLSVDLWKPRARRLIS